MDYLVPYKTPNSGSHSAQEFASRCGPCARRRLVSRIRLLLFVSFF